MAKKQTQIVYRSNEPHWENEHFEFPLRGTYFVNFFSDLIEKEELNHI